MDDQVIKLILDLIGQEKVRQFTEEIKSSKKSVDSLKPALNEIEKEVYEFSDVYELAARKEAEATTQMVVTAKAGWKAIEIAQDSAGGSLARVSLTKKEAEKEAARLRQSVNNLSYSFQDFTATSGDLGAKLNSITNNIPIIVSGLGAWGIAIGFATTAGVALYRSWDDIATLWRDRNPFLDAPDTIDSLTKAVEKDKEALAKLHEASTLSASSLETMLDLTKKLAEEEARLYGTRKAHEAEMTPSKETDERVKDFQGVLKDLGGDQVKKDLRQIVKESSVGLSPEALEQQTTALLSNLARGFKDAQDALVGMAAAGAGKGTKLAERALSGPQPDEQKLAAERVKAQERTDKAEQERQDRLSEALTKQGEETEKAGNRAAKFADEDEKEEAQKKKNTDQSRAAREQRAAAHARKLATEEHGASEKISGTARGISKETGWNEENSMQAAAESVRLQHEGLDAITATQHAVAEQFALFHGLTERYAAVKADAQRLINESRQAARMLQGNGLAAGQDMGNPL